MSYKAFAVVTDGHPIKDDCSLNEECLTQLKVCESTDQDCVSLLTELKVCDADDVGCIEKYSTKDLELPIFRCIYADSTTTSPDYEKGGIGAVIEFVKSCPEPPQSSFGNNVHLYQRHN